MMKCDISPAAEEKNSNLRNHHRYRWQVVGTVPVFLKKKLIRRTGILCVVWHPVGDGYFLKVKKGKEVCYLLLVYSEIRGVYLI